MFRVYRSPVWLGCPIAFAFLGGLGGIVTLSVWIKHGDRLENFAQIAAYLSLVLLSLLSFLFSLLSFGSLGANVSARSIGRKRWQLWPKPPTVDREELLAAIRQEVKARSQQSLHQAVVNTLMFDKHPGEEIPRLWDLEIKIGQKPVRTINPSEKILDNLPQATQANFSQSSNLGRILILGMQGSGKSSTLLELAADWCDRALSSTKSPIPILLDLPNWQPAQRFPTWILSEIHRKYGVRGELSQQWLKAGQLLLLLDGLDELDSPEQEACIAALNQLKLADGRSQPLVVCTRMNCYKQNRHRLKFSAAIGLKTLQIEQIRQYLIASRSRELWENIKDNHNLLALAKIPLFLNLMTLANEEILIHAWKRLTNKKDRIDYLFNAYLRSQLGRQIISQWYKPGKQPTPEQTKHWLKWLATTINQQHHTEFSLENLPYSPLEYVGHFVCLGLVFTLAAIYSVIFLFFYTINLGLVDAIFFLGLGGIFVAYFAKIFRTVAPIALSINWLFISGINSLILFIIGLLSFPLNSWLINQANSQSGGLLYGLSLLIFLVAIAPVVGLIVSIYAALPWLKHLSLRLSLWRQGDIPWNYGRFLEFLTERLFMQKIRGRYRFIHSLLHQHLLTFD